MVVAGGGDDDVGGQPIGGQTVKNKVGPLGTLTAVIMAAICMGAVGGPLR